MKKEELNYYDVFIENTNIAINMATILKDYIDNFDYEASEEKEKKVHYYEREADKNMHKVLKYLVSDFLPPIERDDIVTISYKMDDMIDNIDEIVTNIDILDIKIIRNDFKEFVKLALKMCQNASDMMNKFKTSKKYEEVHELVISLNDLEGKGDKLFQNAIRELYSGETDAVEILKWHKIYECAENFFDSCEGLANTMREVILKNM